MHFLLAKINFLENCIMYYVSCFHFFRNFPRDDTSFRFFALHQTLPLPHYLPLFLFIYLKKIYEFSRQNSTSYFSHFLVRKFKLLHQLKIRKYCFLMTRLFCWFSNTLIFFLVLPIPLTIAWVTTKLYEKEADATHCGIGYSLLPSYWILEGPRIACIMVIIIFIFFIFLSSWS